MTGSAELRRAALESNLRIWRAGLVVATFGNVSVIDRMSGTVAIKPSGVGYDALGVDDMVVSDLDGRIVSGDLRPSSDLDSHLVLYRAFPTLGGVVHTHSRYATIFAQARRAIPPLGTTHADYFQSAVPVARELTEQEIAEDYVAATGRVLVEAHAGRDPLETPAALAAAHGPFTWGASGAEAVRNAEMLEYAAELAFHTLLLEPACAPLPAPLLARHYRRKHGADATYGQPGRRD